jgi:murein DD-endopeptidase MepM/ murein hydrolase activator NlpD
MRDRAPQAAPRARFPLEAWAICAFAWLAAEVAVAIYLGSRPDGRGPVLAYYAAPAVLVVGALALGAWGLAVALRRKPFLRRARVLAFSALALVIGTASYPLPFPAAREHSPSAVELDLPVEGEWTVQWGGTDAARSLLARSRPDRRFGWDLVLERDGARHAGDGGQLEQWFAFGAALSAPCDGTVVSAVDGLADRAPGERGAQAAGPGNHVVLEITPGEYLFLANLQRGSIAVAAGDRVARGAPLAAVGNSGEQGFTSGPHLALHLQDTPEPRWGQGIPIALRGVLVDGRPVERAQPRGRSLVEKGVGGERVRRAP